MSDIQIKNIFLFYFLVFFNEKNAIKISNRTIGFFKKKIRTINHENDKNLFSSEVNILFVSITYKMWKKYYKKFSKEQKYTILTKNLVFPSNLSLDLWREFKNNVRKEELLALTWSKVLNINDEEIARGLGISVGTIRYRVARALDKLGFLSF